MTNMILGLGLALLIGLAVYRTVQRSRKGSGCCGEHETVSQKSVSDHNKAHYPHQVSLKLGGMTCDNCARRVANALNSLDGTWASVRFESKSATVRLKAEPEEEKIRRAVAEAGYVVMDYQVDR